MSTEWLDMLHEEDNGGKSTRATTGELKQYIATDGAQICDLSEYLIYEVTGSDAASFLQGQFCNDLTKVSVTQAQITGYCTPKGRLLALPTIVGFENGFRMLLNSEVADAFIKRLSMFIMRSDVTVRLCENWSATGITVSEAAAAELPTQILGSLPVGALAVASDSNAQLIRWHDDHSAGQVRARYLRIALVQSQITLWKAWKGAKNSVNTWRLSDISAGVPSIRAAVVDAFVPQMMNLQLIDALSFTKGCYPGQEIVARMQYLGKLKRHMRVFLLPLDNQSEGMTTSPQPGDSLACGADENAGLIVDSMPVSAGEALVLAVTKVKSEDELFSVAGQRLTPQRLPYDLPSMDVA